MDTSSTQTCTGREVLSTHPNYSNLTPFPAVPLNPHFALSKAVDNLEFRGEDSEECNKFISAVLNYAFTQGKQRDDEWVADFVATCFRDDALRWWTGLNPHTQESWKQLRHAMTQYYRPSFYGTSGEEAEQFVHLVYKRALDAGRQGDNRWIAEFVPTCFKGGALRWFSSLDLTARNDWGLLQEAIFRQYPSADVSACSRFFLPSPFPFTSTLCNDILVYTHRITPTPAAAAAPAHPVTSFKKGRVRVEQAGVYPTFYLSRTFGRQGMVVRTQSRDDALQVEYDPTCNGPQELVIPDVRIDDP